MGFNSAFKGLKAERDDKGERDNRSVFAHMLFERILPMPRNSMTSNCDNRNINLVVSVGILADNLG